MNVSGEYIFLKKGSEIAKASPVEVQDEQEPDSVASATEPDFSHVDPLLEGVTDDATENDKEELKAILHKYSVLYFLDLNMILGVPIWLNIPSTQVTPDQ